MLTYLLITPFTHLLAMLGLIRTYLSVVLLFLLRIAFVAFLCIIFWMSSGFRTEPPSLADKFPLHTLIYWLSSNHVIHHKPLKPRMKSR